MIGTWKANVRAMVFKRLDPKFGEIRILMYYWQQNRRGGTATEARMGNYRDLSARINNTVTCKAHCSITSKRDRK